MEKFNQAPVPDKDEISEEFEASPQEFMNDVSSSPESTPESPNQEMLRLQQRKEAISSRLYEEFSYRELEEVDRVQNTRLAHRLFQASMEHHSGETPNVEPEEIPPRTRAALDMYDQMQDIDTAIDQLFNEEPALVEQRLHALIAENAGPEELLKAREGTEHTGYAEVTRKLSDNPEFRFLISKFEVHRGYDKTKDRDTPETWSPKYDFVDACVLQLAQEKNEEINAFETLSNEERKRYPDKQTVREKLSYQDADLPSEQLETMLRDAEDRETAEKYAHHLNQLPKEEIDRVLPSIKGQTKKVLDTLGIPISPYGTSDSWAYWDLGKQQYYYEQNKDSEHEEGDPYRHYAPALEKVDEISERHIGWEFYHASSDVQEDVLASITDRDTLQIVYDCLQNEPKADGQIRSYQYARLGAALRYDALSKY